MIAVSADIFRSLYYVTLRYCHVQSVVATITAHKNPVACAAFNHRGNLATASVKVCFACVTWRCLPICDCWDWEELNRLIAKCVILRFPRTEMPGNISDETCCSVRERKFFIWHKHRILAQLWMDSQCLPLLKNKQVSHADTVDWLLFWYKSAH